MKVTAYDIYGNKTTNTTDKSNPDGTLGGGFTIFIDRIKPKCSIKINGVVGDNGWYKDKNITLTLEEKDSESGILKHGLQTNNNFSSLPALSTVTTLTKTQGNTSGVTWYGYVSDKAGNVCEYNTSTIKVDTEKPTCSITSNTSTEPINSTDWYNKYTYDKIATLKLNSLDNGPSGVNRHIMAIEDNNLSKNYKGYSDIDTIDTRDGELTYYGYVRDNAGNYKDCSVYIRRDTIDPLCPLVFDITYKANDRCCTYCSSAKDGVCTNWATRYVSPNVTFNWLGFSGDTKYAEAYVTEYDGESLLPPTKRPEKFENSAIYTIDGKVEFFGYYTTELVVYDEAGNDGHCEGKKSSEISKEEHKCEKVDDDFYNDDGVIVDEEQYKAACEEPNYCEERKVCPESVENGEKKECPEYCKYPPSNLGGGGSSDWQPTYRPECDSNSCEYCSMEYYNKHGEKVEYEDYRRSCFGYSCEIIEKYDGTNEYYDKDGYEVDEEEFEKSCGDLNCRIINGKYYDALGDVVSKAEYLESCGGEEKNFCEIIDEKYYDKNGEEVTEEEYNESCKDESGLECPTITATEDEKTWTNEDVTLNFEFSKDTTLYEWYTNDKNDNFSFQSTNGVATTSKTISAEGKRIGKLIISDKDGNKKECLTKRYYIDKTPPKCKIDEIKTKDGRMVDPDVWIKAKTVEAKWKCSDALSKCFEKQTSDKIENLDNKEGEFKLSSIINDKAGNSSTCKVTVKVDNVPPKMLSCRRSDNYSEISKYSCYSDYQYQNRYPPTYVSRPYMEDGGSGVKSIVYDWKDNYTVVHDYRLDWNLEDPSKHYSCIATASKLESFLYKNLCDNVGNCAPDTYKTFRCN